MDGLQELMGELEENRRDLGVQMVNGRTFGMFHSYSAWARYSSILNADEFSGARGLVQEAYSRTDALNEKTRVRYDAASHDDVNDPEWPKLTVQEVQERAEALEAVDKALATLQAAGESSP
jgi:hypothetical protein